MKISKLSFYLIGNIIAWSIILFNILLYVTPYNAFEPSDSKKKLIFNLTPEGWGFFTKDSREEMPILFRKTDDMWVLDTHPNSYYKNFFGASRKQRKRNIEIALIKEEIPDSNWIKVDENIGYSAFSRPKIKAIHIKNKTLNPILNGEYIFVLQEPVPFAWSRNIELQKMPYRYSYVCIN